MKLVKVEKPRCHWPALPRTSSGQLTQTFKDYFCLRTGVTGRNCQGANKSNGQMSVCLSPGERAPEGHPGRGAEAKRQLPGEFSHTEGETQTQTRSPRLSFAHGA